MTTPKPRRRYLQFSLRALFILVTALAVWFGWTMNEAREQAKAVAWVEEIGGTVQYDYESDDPFNNSEPPVSSLLQKFLGIDFMADVKLVSLSRTEVADLMPLTGLKNLRWLTIEDTQVIDLRPLAGLKNLQVLYVGIQVTDLTPLRGLQNLKSLHLRGTQVSDLTQLSELKNLRTLELNDIKITDMTPLAGLERLEWVFLDGTQVTQDQIDALQAALPNCEITWSPPKAE